jgi:hypothetical protein
MAANNKILTKRLDEEDLDDELTCLVSLFYDGLDA